MESTPEPQPTSSRLAGSTSCSSSRQSRVVACAPVPNARPGSIDDGDRPGRRLLPRRPDPEPADGTAGWNARHSSSQPSGDVLEPRRTSTSRIGGSSVSASRDPRRRAPRLLPGRCREARAQLEARRRSITYARPAQRNALFSLSKKPSSVSYVRSSVVLRRTREQAALLVVELPRDEDVDEDRWSPRPKPCRTGMPLAAEDDGSRRAACPAASSSSSSPSSVSIVIVAPSAACDDRQVDGRVDVVAFAHEALVGSRPDARRRRRRRARRARRRGPRRRDGSAGRRGCRPESRHGASRCSITRPRAIALAARRARSDRARAAAVGTRLSADELAEDAPRDVLQPAGAAAASGRSGSSVPGSAPSPPQRVHVTATSNGTSRP